MEKAVDRLDVLEKIKDYESRGLFDIDVEQDPPSRALERGEVDYLGKKLSTRVASKIANAMAKSHFDKCIERGELVIEKIRGIENYRRIADGGAIITANHFNAFDNYAVYKAIEAELGKKRLYKLIREGNYTAFPGLYGFFFRHCNTLPIPSKTSVMKEMMSALYTLLERGEKVLVYPEQAMWWNYRKPRPLKPGAFHFAVTANVPVLPFFITMRDSQRIGADGFPIQKYTVNILEPIYPDMKLSPREREKDMAARNFAAWKECYESFYSKALRYGEDED